MSVAEKLRAIAENEHSVYAAGARAEHDRFWDGFQRNGERSNYSYAFYHNYWDDEVYNPKYDIKAQNLQFAFRYSNITDTKVAIYLNNTYADSGAGIFSNAKQLKTIRKIVLTSTTPISSNMFSNCTALENLTVEGVIGQNGFNVQSSSLLSRASIISIINALSTTTSGLTVTLSRAAVNSAFETSDGAADGSTSAEWSAIIGARSNWTISLI